MTVLPRRRPRQPEQPRQLDAGPLEPLIGSFLLHLAAEGKAARTVQGYTSAVRWFTVGYLLGQAGKTSWEQVEAQDIQRWMTQLLHRYSGAYASIQFRALRQFFKWRADEEELPARASAPAAAVAGTQQPGPAHPRRHLPDRRPPRPAMRRDRLPAPVPAPSATPGWTAAEPSGT